MGELKYTKADRLRKRYDYLYLSKHGTRYFSNYFIILANNNSKLRSRLGVTTSKKVGNARIRNRIKRIIREYFRLNIKGILKSQDINVIARKGLGKLSSFEVFSNLIKAFDCVINKRISLIRSDID